MDVLGVQVKFKAQIDAKPEDDSEPAPAPVKTAPAAKPAAKPVLEKVETTPIAVVEDEPELDEAKSRNSHLVDEDARYGESLLREMLGAEPMNEKNGK
jgi:hypothetical protein